MSREPRVSVDHTHSPADTGTQTPHQASTFGGWTSPDWVPVPAFAGNVPRSICKLSPLSPPNSLQISEKWIYMVSSSPGLMIAQGCSRAKCKKLFISVSWVTCMRFIGIWEDVYLTQEPLASVCICGQQASTQCRQFRCSQLRGWYRFTLLCRMLHSKPQVCFEGSWPVGPFKESPTTWKHLSSSRLGPYINLRCEHSLNQW